MLETGAAQDYVCPPIEEAASHEPDCVQFIVLLLDASKALTHCCHHWTPLQGTTIQQHILVELRCKTNSYCMTLHTVRSWHIQAC